MLRLQGVVAGSRVYHQRRRSGFPGDTWSDQPCVPAIFQFFIYGNRLSQEPACRSLLMISASARFAQSDFIGLGNFSLSFSFSQNEHEIFFRILFPIFSGDTAVFARKIHSTSQFAMTILRKCVRESLPNLCSWPETQ